MKKIDGLYELTPEELAAAKAVGSSGRWKPEHKDEYYFVNAYGVIENDTWIDNSTGDWFHYEQRNCFRTEKDAQDHLTYLKAIAEIRDSTDYVPDWNYEDVKYAIYYNRSSQELAVDTESYYDTSRIVYYPTAQVATQAIKDHKQAYLTYFGVKGN